MTTINSELIRHLSQFVVEERLQLFEKKIQDRTQYITVVLENIFQSRNIAASIRSADCFGIQDVHIVENENIFNNDSEVSMGAEKWVTINRNKQEKNNTIQTIQYLKSKGYQIIATTPHNTDCDLYDININQGKIALFFGSEVKGCSKEMLERADKKIKIPIYGFTESYNVSVSVALCLQHLTYNMRQSNVKWQLPTSQAEQVMTQWLTNSIKAGAKIKEDYLKRR